MRLLKVAIRCVIGSLPFALLVSIGLGIASYSLLTPIMWNTIRVSDGEGHGPDPGGPEWEYAARIQMKERHNWVVAISIAIGVLTLPTYLKFIKSRPELSSTPSEDNQKIK
jgi:hypothetical protein